MKDRYGKSHHAWIFSGQFNALCFINYNSCLVRDITPQVVLVSSVRQLNVELVQPLLWKSSFLLKLLGVSFVRTLRNIEK